MKLLVLGQAVDPASHVGGERGNSKCGSESQGVGSAKAL